MYIRKVSHTNKKNQQGYHTFKLVESVRTERGPRQRTMLNLGRDFTLPEDQWKDLANRIEEIVTGQAPLFVYSAEIEDLANRYSRRITGDCRRPVLQEKASSSAAGVEAPDYHRVDIETVDSEHARTVGAEHVVYETIRELGLDEKFRDLGFNKPAVDAAIGVIAARLIAPASERSTHGWLQDMTALDDLLGADFGNLSQDRVYKTADMLLRRRSEIEEHLRRRECNLFHLEETLILYDLTNTFFEGSGKYNGKAHFGHSKEKRTDCPLVTLGLVLDADGFPKRSDIFDGNVSEAGTLEGMITALSSPDMLVKPLVVTDAGIATQKNIGWFKEHGYSYIVVSRKKKIEVPPSLEMVTVREDKQRLIRAALVNNPDTEEIELYCHSSAKAIKEEGIRNRFERRFEEALTKTRAALSKKHGTKRYEKVLEKIGRLKERFKRVARRYEIEVAKDVKTNLATAIVWERKEQDDRSGFYCLRSNRLDFKEQELFNLFSMLTDIEEAFRSMKSELGLRPVYHQKERRVDGHLFITVLAYHVLHAIRFKLRKRGMTQSWSTIRKGLSTHMRITTTMKRDDGKMIHIRKSSRSEPFHVQIYDALNLPHRPGKTIKTVL
jgi:transposase